MLGRVNVYNLLAAAAAAYARDVEPNAISEAADQIAHVAGRFERLDLGQPFTVIVDYAHTDDAIRNLTAVAHDFLHQRGGPGTRDHRLRMRRRPRPRQASADGRGGRKRQRLRGADQRQSAQRRPHRHHERRSARTAAHRRSLHAGARPQKGDRVGHPRGRCWRHRPDRRQGPRKASGDQRRRGSLRRRGSRQKALQHAGYAAPHPVES